MIMCTASKITKPKSLIIVHISKGKYTCTKLLAPGRLPSTTSSDKLVNVTMCTASKITNNKHY